MDAPAVGPTWRTTPGLHLLPFPDLWTKLQARPFTYDDVISLRNKGVGWLEFRNRLNSTRSVALDANGPSGDPASAIAKTENHIGCLAYLIEHLDRFMDDGAKSRVCYRWASAMVPGNLLGPWMITLPKSPALDQAMMILRVAIAMWQEGLRRGADIYRKDAPEPAVSALTASVDLLRRAAGAFGLLSDTLWPSLAASFGSPKEQAPEVVHWFADACRQVCLGIAQYLVAYRSYCKATNFGVAAQLYVAASDFFERAAAVSRSAATDGYRPASERFMRYVALFSSLATARARLCQTQQLLASGDAGRACVQASHAKNELRLCAYVADHDEEWLAVFKAAEADVVAVWEQCELDRRSVHFQTLSNAAPEPLPAGTALVAAVPYVQPRQEITVEDDDV